MYAIVIPAGSIGNLTQCLNTIIIMEPGAQNVIVVGDDIDWSLLQRNVVRITGKKPFIFAQNVNVGIHYALTRTNVEGVIVLGDDGLLMNPLGFTKLHKTAMDNPEYGIMSASTNNACNPNQIWKSDNDLRDEPKMVAFVCVHISRNCVDKTGYMDERFVNYGYDDNDYCRRALTEGFKIGVYDGCKINHVSLPSMFRNGDIDETVNKKLYEDKWNTSV